MAREKISSASYITPEQSELLKVLHQRTKVPRAECIRQGIHLVAGHRQSQLPDGLISTSFGLGSAWFRP
ncbi:MAG TPA: ribbon-helix-helix domain-containing protein [Myxococcaceae bacterium]|nr:ribbon-helix-helix domain-containing protein [Myxococcaceae bacterium]